MYITLVVLLFAVSFGQSHTRNETFKQSVRYYTNTWLVKTYGGYEAAKVIAENENFEILEEIEGFPGLFRFLHKKHPKRVKYENIALTEKIYQYEEVAWAEHIATTRSSIRKCRCPLQQESSVCAIPNPPVKEEYYNLMYYVHDCRTSGSQTPILDLNVISVWEDMQIYGKNSVVMVIDQGVDTTHPELRFNFVPALGYDLVDEDSSPDPEALFSSEFTHGTICTGIIAGKADNHLCGVGMAPLVKWGAIRLHAYSKATDDMEAKALSFKVPYVDISNNSWGPDDDGVTMEYLKHFKRSAFKYGITKGRRGKGTLYVFAAGNGKRRGDMCGYDCFANSIYTIVVAGADEHGRATEYSERCSAVMVTAYSEKIVSSINFGQCTTDFTGTSAAAPLVSGILALVLEANRDLSWRDIYHILAWTSNPTPLQNNPGWKLNAAGFWLSHDFGFGLINAAEAVKMAKTFTNVPPMSVCVVPIEFRKYDNHKFSRTSVLEVSIRTKACQGLPCEIRYIEHVELHVNITCHRRGDLNIDLKSPQGTVSHLIEPREHDAFTDGLKEWTIDTVHSWGESPRGHWRITIHNKIGHSSYEGEVRDLMLLIYGTKDKPAHYTAPRPYYEFHPLK